MASVVVMMTSHFDTASFVWFRTGLVLVVLAMLLRAMGETNEPKGERVVFIAGYVHSFSSSRLIFERVQ